MASSGTYTFAPSIADLFLEAFGRCQIRRADLTAAHIADARMAANLALQEWSVKGVNLWAVDLDEITLVADQTQYDLDATCVSMLDTYIRTGTADAPQDRILFPVGRSDYAAFPDKVTSGFPTVYWFQREIAPKVTLWQPPDDAETYTLRYYFMRRLQDANIAAGETPDIPSRFLEAFAASVAYRLARIWKPELEDKRKQDALEAWAIAAGDDVENVAITIAPQVGAYYRR